MSGRTGVVQGARPAVGLARVAGGAPVQDQPVRQVRPLLGREAGGDLPFDAHRVGGGVVPVVAPAQPARHADHMRIHGEAGHVERVAEHHVGGFAAHAGQCDQLLHGARHPAGEPGFELGGQGDDVARLGMVEADGADDVLHTLRVGRRQRRGRGIGGEQRGGDRVHTLVGGLGAQHGGHQQLERGVEIERARRLGNDTAEDRVFVMHAPQPGAFGFARNAHSSPRASSGGSNR